MAMYRCAMCGSTKIEPEIKKEGYNKKKGVRGVILFGAIGALAGSDGNTVTYYHCGDCGQVLNHTMMDVEKNAIDRCISNPDTYISSLKKYKKQYVNIEWEEPIIIHDETTSNVKEDVSDEEDRILEYMSRIGAPVLTDILFKKFSVQVIKNLNRRGALKFEGTEKGTYCILVTDVKEIEEVALQEEANDRTKKLIRTKDYISILKEVLTDEFMTREDIYVRLKENNYLSEDVLEAEKENAYIPLYFVKNCFLDWQKKVAFSGRTEVVPIICKDGKYRLKTDEEMAKDKIANSKEADKEVIKEVETLKPLIETLLKAKKPISVGGLMSSNEILDNIPGVRLSGKLSQLEKAGIVKRKLDGKISRFYIVHAEDEVYDKLYEAVMNKTVRGLL